MSPNRLRLVICLTGLVLLVGWQLMLFRQAWPVRYPFKASSGIAEQDKFIYFLYYANVFPVASTNNGLNSRFYYTRAGVAQQPNRLVYSRAGAERTLEDAGRTLVMEWGHTIRSGQLLITYLFLPDAWRLGSPEHAEVRITHGLLFIAALASVYLMSWYAGVPVFGTVFVLLVGSNPFQLYEAYRNENVFGWPITALCFVLALALPLLVKKRVPVAYAIAAVIVAGAFTATVAQIRPEPAMLGGAMILAVATAASYTWRTRALLVVLLVVTTASGVRLWNGFFDRKFAEAARVVSAAGGHVLSGTRDRYHAFWHPIWCGLSDFDTTHGYAWSDAAALAFAQPILRAKYNQELPWWWGVEGKQERERTADDYLDPSQTYYRIPFQTPHYEEVLRDKVLGDIRRDPSWYGGILGRRVLRMLRETTTPHLTASVGLALPIPFSGLLVVPLLVVAVWLRRWTDVKIVLFTCAISVTGLLVFSGRGVPNYSVYHLAALALLASAVSQRYRAVP